MPMIVPRWLVLVLAATPLLMACGESESPQPETLKPQAQSNLASQQEQSLLAAQPATDLLQVFKSPSCGCCEGWIEHADSAGFTTQAQHPDDLAGLKSDYGIAPQYRSCHTSISDEGYLFEGHVPARYVKAFLAEPPVDAIGLAVPGMPVGSPGMEMGTDFMPYQVLLLKRDGGAEIYAQVDSPADQ
ncbi:DUF411 domain-containing protein [Pseudomonas sp. 5Ae-yellow]|uniref:DUF411 domain-containing protein n=1 Tax=Pseudomonas sp. 5Ae-yellow TaxID=2759848 RepID=UPI0021751A0E|nr:DUF411 domain-containing protein [Pseudomonas sp. 5Ae-yellow]|tara:strand:- start:506 stop:1066 length:561 start_codon:yes stop_codon:yes gene_type:complete